MVASDQVKGREGSLWLVFGLVSTLEQYFTAIAYFRVLSGGDFCHFSFTLIDISNCIKSN